METTPTPQSTQPERNVDDQGNPIYRIPEGNLDGLKARVEKLNRRAKRLGMAPLALTETGEEFETRRKRVDPDDEELERTIAHLMGTCPARYVEYQVRFILITLTGERPRINGWTFCATIEHGEGGNILRTVPGFEENLPKRYRTAETLCDHCGHDRRRKDTYVLRSDSGEWKQVGRNCLADFLRTSNPAGLAEWAELLASLDEEVGVYEDQGFGGGSGKRYYPMIRLLSQAAACIRNDGWCSRTEARNDFQGGRQASADQALDWFDHKWVSKQRKDKIERYTPSDEDHARAAAAIEWAQAIETDASNDYLWNVRVVGHKESVDGRSAGLAASILMAHARHLERELKRKYENESRLNEWFGTVGERGIYTLRVTGLREIEGAYGLTTLVMFRDEAGRDAKWFASGSPSEFGLDRTLIVKATIKAHETYKDRKQTMLSRVATYDEAAEAQTKADAKEARKILKRYAKTHVCEHAAALGRWNTHYFTPPEIIVLREDWGGAYAVPCCEDCKAKWAAAAAAQEVGK